MDQQFPKTFAKMQMPPINKQSQISIVEIVLLVVIIALFYFFVISPKKAELESLTSKVAALKLEETKITDQKRDLEGLIRKMRSDPEAIAKLTEAIPFDGKVMTLYLLVQKLAAEAGVNLGNLSFGASSESVTAGNRELLKDPYGQTRILKRISGSVSVKGELSQVEGFMKKMEESGRFFDFTDMQFSADPEGGVQLTTGLYTYYFAP